MSIALIALCGTGGHQNESKASLKLWASEAATVAPDSNHIPFVSVSGGAGGSGEGLGGCSNI